MRTPAKMRKGSSHADKRAPGGPARKGSGRDRGFESRSLPQRLNCEPTLGSIPAMTVDDGLERSRSAPLVLPLIALVLALLCCLLAASHRDVFVIAGR